MVKDKAKNYMPNEYWDFSKSGKENAESYLKMCAANNKRPKFYKLLDQNADGSYSLKKDGSTDGYWKLLIDFKMYDNNGVGSPQRAVTPDFSMDEAVQMLNEYKGGHKSYPVAYDVVDEFVKQYKSAAKPSERNKDSMSNRAILANAIESSVQTEIERKKLQDYRENIDSLYENEAKLSELNRQIKELSFAEGKRDTKKLKELREEAVKTANRINKYDKELLRLEPFLSKVLDREKVRVRKQEKTKYKVSLAEYRAKRDARDEATKAKCSR